MAIDHSVMQFFNWWKEIGKKNDVVDAGNDDGADYANEDDGDGDDEENEDYDVDDDARMKDPNTKSIDSVWRKLLL